MTEWGSASFFFFFFPSPFLECSNQNGLIRRKLFLSFFLPYRAHDGGSEEGMVEGRASHASSPFIYKSQTIDSNRFFPFLLSFPCLSAGGEPGPE